MNIKTITTIDGVNEVDFGSSASRFYWFQNLGTTTVHVSGKADIVAGGDGVAELAAGDSVCIEALGGKVYVLGAGKVQIHNTGDKFCPFKNAPAQSGGEAVDAYTKTESDAKYAQKTDIPTTLPANGGNADTLDGKHASEFAPASTLQQIKSTTVSGTTDANGNLMLWAASENKIPICAILTGYCSSIFHYAPDGNYYLGVSDIATQAYSPNVSVGGTVYYIEKNTINVG